MDNQLWVYAAKSPRFTPWLDSRAFYILPVIILKFRWFTVLATFLIFVFLIYFEYKGVPIEQAFRYVKSKVAGRVFYARPWYRSPV
ncbi:IcmT/TraK family protein [Chromobacterium phragmitis]|uniref:IcmT/TraK family protein n=1 Tax=Chromobacterium phragmitis TaxID=2202141 RepID=UPI0018E08EA5